MRVRSYLITLFAYSSIRFLRMAVSFVQADIEDQFQIDHIFMGAISASMYIMVGFGYMYLLFFPIKKALPRYLLNMGLTGSLFVVWGLMSLMDLNEKWVLIAFLGISGFAQAAAWPICIKIVYEYFNYQTDGLLLGIWAANGSIGEGLSFLVNILLTYTFDLQWQSCIIFSGAMTVIMAYFVRYGLVDKDEDRSQPPVTQQTCQSILSYFYSRDNVILLVVVSLLKSTIYGILLWLPMYFSMADFEQFTGYIPMVFCITTVMGSVVLGWFYQCVKNRYLVSTISTSLIGIMVVLLWVIKSLPMDQKYKWQYLMLIGLVGFCLGSVTNQFMGIQSKILAENSEVPLYYVTVILMTFSSLSVGLVQFLIGVFINQDEEIIFQVFLGLALLSLFLVGARTAGLFIKHNQEQKIMKSEQQILAS